MLLELIHLYIKQIARKGIVGQRADKRPFKGQKQREKSVFEA
jgi:hypothetical protein